MAKKQKSYYKPLTKISSLGVTVGPIKDIDPEDYPKRIKKSQYEPLIKLVDELHINQSRLIIASTKDAKRISSSLGSHYRKAMQKAKVPRNAAAFRFIVQPNGLLVVRIA